MMSHSTESIDFFEYFPQPDGSLMFTDWIDLGLFLDTTVVNCTGSYEWPPSRPSLPSCRAYDVLVREDIPIFL